MGRCMFSGLSLLLLVPAYAVGDEQRAVFPSVLSAAQYLGGRLSNDLDGRPNLVERACLVSCEELEQQPDTARASAGLSGALEVHGFLVVTDSGRSLPNPKALPVIKVRTSLLPDAYIFQVTLGQQIYQAVYLDKDWVDADSAMMSDHGYHEIKVSSELRVDEAEAVEEVGERLAARVIALLSQRAGAVPSQKDLRSHLPALFNRPEVERDEYTERQIKPYGTLYRKYLWLKLRDDSINHWLSDIVEQRRMCLYRFVGATGITGIAWLTGFWSIVKLDRWTHGYRRKPIVVVALASLLAFSTFLWVVVLF
jgi:hypothetical protein